MRVGKVVRSLQRELIRPDPAASFLVRRFRVPRFPFVWHYHPEAELTCIIRGDGLRFVADSIEAFDSGDLVLLGPNVPHTWQSTVRSRGGCEAIVVQFLPTLWSDLLQRSPEFRGIAQLMRESARGLSIDDAALRHRARTEMERTLAAPSGSMTQWLGLTQVLQWIAEAAAGKGAPVRPLSVTPRPSDSRNDAGARRLERVLQALHESVENGTRLTQEGAADCAGMSPASFSRFFRHRVGRTFVRYANEWRVELACRRIVQERTPITQIAFACGFENLSNFNRRFREIKGMTPRQLRRRQEGA